jgi:hypothetical protein
MTKLQTRMNALREAGATQNYSKIIELDEKFKQLDIIEKSQPQINEYIRPIPAPKPVYAEKPENTYIPKIEKPKVAIPTVSRTESNDLSQTEDLKLPLGLTIGAVAMVALIGIGVSTIPKSEKVAVNSQPDPIVKTSPVVAQHEPSNVQKQQKPYSEYSDLIVEENTPIIDRGYHARATFIINPECSGDDKDCDFTKVKNIPKTLTLYRNNGTLGLVIVGSGLKNLKEMSEYYDNTNMLCGVKVETLLSEINEETQMPRKYTNTRDHWCNVGGIDKFRSIVKRKK